MKNWREFEWIYFAGNNIFLQILHSCASVLFFGGEIFVHRILIFLLVAIFNRVGLFLRNHSAILHSFREESHSYSSIAHLCTNPVEFSLSQFLLVFEQSCQCFEPENWYVYFDQVGYFLGVCYSQILNNHSFFPWWFLCLFKEPLHEEFYCIFVWSNTFFGVFKHFFCLIKHLFLGLISQKPSNTKTEKLSNISVHLTKGI